MELTLDGNVVSSEPIYRSPVLELCHALRSLDLRRVTDEERRQVSPIAQPLGHFYHSKVEFFTCVRCNRQIGKYVVKVNERRSGHDTSRPRKKDPLFSVRFGKLGKSARRLCWAMSRQHRSVDDPYVCVGKPGRESRQLHNVTGQWIGHSGLGGCSTECEWDRVESEV